MDTTLRDFVRQRAGNRCEYCRLHQRHTPVFTFHIEHIRAKQHGGTDDPLNLALACNRCNRAKGPNLSSVDPVTGQLVRLFNPREDTWETHFAFQDATIVGRTPEGRATVELLKMNEAKRVRTRATLITRGQFA
jgi:HNH endonuclease